jgi:hypothetical protein
MGKRNQQKKRDRYYAGNLSALLVLSKRLGTKAQETEACDECDFGLSRHWKKPRHAWSFCSISYGPDGAEADWSVCGYCLPAKYREEMAAANYWNTRLADRRMRQWERNYFN